MPARWPGMHAFDARLAVGLLAALAVCAEAAFLEDLLARAQNLWQTLRPKQTSIFSEPAKRDQAFRARPTWNEAEPDKLELISEKDCYNSYYCSPKLLRHAELNPAPKRTPGLPVQEWEDLYDQWCDQVATTKEPIDVLPFTPLLTCERDTSPLLKRFDWKISVMHAQLDVDNDANMNDRSHAHAGCGYLQGRAYHDVKKKEDPDTVWVNPLYIDRLLVLAAKHFDPRRSDRMLMISGTELPLSVAFGTDEHTRNATLRSLKKYFNRINVMTKDMDMDGVHVAPMGLCWGYMIIALKRWMLDPSRPMHEFWYDWSVALQWKPEWKSKHILAPGSLVAAWLEKEETIDFLDPLAYLGNGFPPSNSSLWAVAMAYKARVMMKDWLGVKDGVFTPTEAARKVHAEYRVVHAKYWWQELSKYMFLISPTGSAIQAAKSIEALLVCTVPIIPHMGFNLHNELISMGFPMVVVHSFEEITVQNTTKWWAKLAPRLDSFRRNCLTNDGYWKMLTGEVSFCE